MFNAVRTSGIIPYKEPLGNYNKYDLKEYTTQIIPYQEPLGNYNSSSASCTLSRLYHTKNR